MVQNLMYGQFSLPFSSFNQTSKLNEVKIDEGENLKSKKKREEKIFCYTIFTKTSCIGENILLKEKINFRDIQSYPKILL